MCPVCGYDRLPYPAESERVCPCCGTEFGYDDFGHSHEQLRRRWIEVGCPWFSQFTRPPSHWTPILQLQNVLIPDVADNV